MAWNGRFVPPSPPYYQPRYPRPPRRGNNNRRNFSLEGLDAISNDVLFAYFHDRFGMSNVSETPNNSNRSSQRYHGNRNTGHAYGDPVIDGYGTTVLGDMTQYYILPDAYRRSAQMPVSPTPTVPRVIQESRALHVSQLQHHVPDTTARERQLKTNFQRGNSVRDDSGTSSRSSDMMTPTSDLSFRSSSSLVDSEHTMPLSQNSNPPGAHTGPTQAYSSPITTPTNASTSISSWRETVLQNLQLTDSRPAHAKQQSLLHITAAFGDFDRSYDPSYFDCFSQHCHVSWAHSIIDATDSLKDRKKAFNAVFVKDFSFTMLTRYTKYRFLNALMDYTRSGGTTIFHGWQQGPGVNYFFSEICSLPWRTVEGDPNLKGYVKNACSWVRPKDSPPNTLQRVAFDLQNVASKDLLYEASGEPTQGPFAITQYGKGRIGWFGDTFHAKHLQTILLSMLGLIKDDDTSPNASPAKSPSEQNDGVVGTSTPESESTQGSIPAFSQSLDVFDYRDYRELYDP